MRWLWVPLFLVAIIVACNSSNGSACASAGGTCTIGACLANYCSGGVCWTVLPQSAQDCSSSSISATNPGQPCCVQEVDSGTPEDAGQSEDAGSIVDATVGTDAHSPADAAAADADSSVVTDASRDGESEAEASTLGCQMVNDACVPDGGGEDASAPDAAGGG
jgi:hypothetical protein